MKHSNSETSWTFECLTDSSGKPPEGGLVLQEVRHDGHNFAKDIRTIGLWIYMEDVDRSGKVLQNKKKFRILASSNNFTVSPIRTLKPKPIDLGSPVGKTLWDYLKEADTAMYFADYFKDPGGNYVAYGVAAKYQAPQLLADLGIDNCEYSGLSVEQIFLFSRYASEPRHEPTGGLMAARFHPLIRYEFELNKNCDKRKSHTRISSIRFDFRLHLFLDNHYEHQEFNVPQLREIPNVPGFGNQAGLFADKDSIGRPGPSQGKIFRNVGPVLGSAAGGIQGVLIRGG